MNRRCFLRLTAQAVGAGVFGSVAGAMGGVGASKGRRPNIIIILADDLGYGDPGCYNDESKIPTPNLDRLAGEGVRFTDAHTPSSVCTPTRYGILTGRYCWRTALKSSVLWPWDEPLIKADRLTLPTMLGKEGYHTGCVGKWHLGWEWPTKDGARMNDTLKIGKYNDKQRTEFSKRIDYSKRIKGGPVSRGFDYYFGDDVPNFPPYCFIENDRIVGEPPSVDKPVSMFGNNGPMQAGWELDEVMPKITERAVGYVRDRAKEKDRPFFLFFTLTAPHTPIAPGERFIGKSGAGLYGDYVHQVDWTVGEITKALADCGAADDTLLIFTSDNGSPQRNGKDMSGPTGSVPKEFGHDPSRPWRGMKGDIWEGGHRVPFIGRWPGKIKAGGVCDELICLSDLMATCASIVGQKLGSNSGEDSFDILHALLGRKSDKPIRESIVHHSGNGVFAIRQGKWKLILGKGSGGFTRYNPPADAPAGQLYNLLDDPGESDNLYESRPEIVKRLGELLGRYQKQGRTV